MSGKTNRKYGAMFGLAVGDALGMPVEFKKRGTFEPVVGYRTGGSFGLTAGQWTDDTSMMLTLADSIAEKGWDPKDQVERYIEWYRYGKYGVNGKCVDIGCTVAGALRQFCVTKDWKTSGNTHEESGAGNGCIMRLAPVPVKFFDMYESGRLFGLMKIAAESSMTTHNTPVCVSACQYMTLVLCELIAGRSKEEALDPNGFQLSRLKKKFGLHPEIEKIANGSYKQSPPKIRGTGYVVDSLEAALWAFYRADNFEDAVLAAVNLGEDADTTGAVCGQIAGAFWGADAIPTRFCVGLDNANMIWKAAERLIYETI